MQTRTKKHLYRWGGGVAAIVILLGIMVAMLPFGVKWWMNGWLQEQGLKSRIEAVRISLWDGGFTLQGLAVEDPHGKAIDIGELSVAIDTGALFDKTVDIRRFVLRDAFVTVSRAKDQPMHVGGIRLGGAEQPKSQATPAAPWGIRLRGVELTNIEVCYDLAGVGEQANRRGCARFKQLNWTGSVTYEPTPAQDDIDHLLEGNVDLALNGFGTETDTGKVISISFEGLSLNKVDIANRNKIRLNQLLMRNPSGSVKRRAQNGELEAIAAFDMQSIRLDKVALMNTSEIDIGHIQMEKPVFTGRWTSEEGTGADQLSLALASIGMDKIRIDRQQHLRVAAVEMAKLTGKRQPAQNADKKLPADSLEIQSVAATGVSRSAEGRLTLGKLVVQGLAAGARRARPGRDTHTQLDLGINAMQAEKFEMRQDDAYSLDTLRIDRARLADNEQGGRPLIELMQASVSGVAFKGVDTIELDSVAFNQVGVFSRVPDPESVTAAHFRQYLDSVTATGVVVRELSGVVVDQFKLNGVQLLVVRGEQGGLQFERPLQQWMGGNGSANTNPKQTDDGSPFRVQAKGVSIDGNSQIELHDHSFQPVLQRRIHSIEMSLSNVDSANSEAMSRFSLSLVAGDHGNMLFEGEGQLFNARPTVNAKGKIKGVDLSKFSAYAQGVIQHEIKSGHLNADLNIKIDKGQLDSLVNLTLYKFYLGAAPKKDTEYEKQLGMPLSTALSLLREKDDSINIKLPVTGDITAPDFSLKHVIRGVMADAIKQALINYYTPFGLVTLAETAFDFLTALRFKPVEFAPGEVALDSADRTALDKIASMLRERKGVRLVVCGKAVLEDRISLFDVSEEQAQQMREIFKTHSDAGPDLSQLPELTHEQKARLKTLAEERTTRVKRYLGEQGGIAPDRLIECNPSYDPADAGQPRTVIGV